MSEYIPYNIYGRVPIFTVNLKTDSAPSDAELRGLAVVEALKQGADIRGADLTGVDLAGMELVGIDLRGAELSRASLSTANLTRARLEGANLRTANLIGACLDEACLKGADLSGTNLDVASCRKACFDDTILLSCRLEGADLSGATLNRAKLGRNIMNRTQWQQVDLTDIHRDAMSQLAQYASSLDVWREALREGHHFILAMHTAAKPGSLWQLFMQSIWIGDTPSDDAPQAQVAFNWLEEAIRLRNSTPAP